MFWDIDRGIFMGQIEMSSLDLPIEDIPLDIKSWLELGWRFGSYSERYEQPEEESEDEAEEEDADDAFTDPDFEQQLKQPMLSPRQRSKQLNLVMRAMVRTMAELYNDLHVAYAMDKTKRHFTKQQLEDNKSKEAKAWLDAQDEYNNMSWKKQFEWRERVMKTHPRLDKLARP